MGTLGDFSPGNGIVAQALLSVSDVPPRFIDPGSLHSRTAGGAPCSSRRSASLLRPQGALGFGPTGRAQLQSPQPPSLGPEPAAASGTEAHRRQWNRSPPPPVGLAPAARCAGKRQAERREPQGAAKAATMWVPRRMKVGEALGITRSIRRMRLCEFPGG